MNRPYLSGGHNFAKDSGFSLMEPTETAKLRLRHLISAHPEEMLEWVASAHHLTRVIEQMTLADGAFNLPMNHELVQAEARYDRARATAQALIESYQERF